MGPVHPDYADALRVEQAMYEQAGRTDKAADVVAELARIGDEATLDGIAAAIAFADAERQATEKAAAAKAAAEKPAPKAKPVKPDAAPPAVDAAAQS